MIKWSKIIVFALCMFAVKMLCSQTVSWQIKPCWDSVEALGNDMLRVEAFGKWGVVRFDGTSILPTSYPSITNMCENRFAVLDSEGKVLLIGDENGNVKAVDEVLFVDTSWPYYSEGLLAVKNSDGLWGYLDQTGKLVIKNQFKNAFPFLYGRASVCETKNRGWCHINTRGEHLSKFYIKHYSFASSFTNIEGYPPMAFVLVDDKANQGESVCLINLEGNIQENDILNEDVAFDELLNKDMFICSNGNTHIEIKVNKIVEIESLLVGDRQYACTPIVSWTNSFSPVDGVEVCSCGIIKVGGVSVSPQFEEIIPLNQNHVLVKKDNKWGVIKVDLSKQMVHIYCDMVSELKVYHAFNIPFSVSNANNTTRVYAIDSKGELTFVDRNESGMFPIPSKCIHEDDSIFLGLEMDGIRLEPEKYAIKVQYGDGFEVSGPPKATVGKNGYVSFHIVIRNNTDQDAAPFDVYVDNNLIEHVEGLQHQQSIAIPVSMKVAIRVLEDYVIKKTKVKLEEKGFPSNGNYSVSIKFERMLN